MAKKVTVLGYKTFITEITTCPDDVWRIFGCSKHIHRVSQRYSMTY